MEQNSKITYDKTVSGTVETAEWFEGREMKIFVDCCLQIPNVIKHLTCTGFKYSCGTLTCAPHLSALGLSVGMHDMKRFLFFFPRPNPSITFQKTIWMCSCYIFMFQDLKKRMGKKKSETMVYQTLGTIFRLPCS